MPCLFPTVSGKEGSGKEGLRSAEFEGQVGAFVFGAARRASFHPSLMMEVRLWMGTEGRSWWVDRWMVGGVGSG